MRRLTLFAYILVSVSASHGCSNRISKAEELLKVGSNAEALELVTEEIKSNPNNPEAYFLKGRILEADGNIYGMFKVFNSAIKTSPKFNAKIGNYLWEQVRSNEANDSREYIYEAFKFYPDLENDEEAVYARFVTHDNNSHSWQTYLTKFPQGKHVAEVNSKIESYIYENSSPEIYIEKYPKGKHIAGALLKLAQRRYNNKEISLAKSTYRQIIKQCPNTDESAQAQNRLENWWEELEIPITDPEKYSKIMTVRKGQEIEISVVGEIVFNRINYIRKSDLAYFFGTQKEVESEERPLLISIGAPFDYWYKNNWVTESGSTKYYKRKEWDGRATKDGYLWVTSRFINDHFMDKPYLGQINLRVRYKVNALK